METAAAFLECVSNTSALCAAVTILVVVGTSVSANDDELSNEPDAARTEEKRLIEKIYRHFSISKGGSYVVA